LAGFVVVFVAVVAFAFAIGVSLVGSTNRRWGHTSHSPPNGERAYEIADSGRVGVGFGQDEDLMQLPALSRISLAATYPIVIFRFRQELPSRNIWVSRDEPASSLSVDLTGASGAP
jgi:hypothetical protein